MRIASLLLLILCLAAAAPAAVESPFGMVATLDPGRDPRPEFRALREAGARWVRVRPDWRALQPEAGPPSWEWTDGVIRAAREEGLEVVFTLGYTPRWASRYADSAETDVVVRNPPKDLAVWQEYVRRLSGRYSKEVGHWQIWEQPSLHRFRGSWKDLRDMLAASTKATRGREVRRQILPESGSLNLSAIDQMYTWGADVYFDVLGLYPSFAKPEEMLRPLRTLKTQIVEKKGPRKELWVAGLGWDVSALPAPVQAPVVSEDDQARFLVRGVAMALGEGVRRVFWDGWRDVVDGPYQEQVRSGLLRADGSPRPALQAWRSLAAALEGLSYSGCARWGPHAWGYVFASGDRAALVGWTDRDSLRVALPDGLRVADHLGRSVEAGDALTLDGAPRVVTGTRALVDRLAANRPERELAADPDYSGVDVVSVTLGERVVDQGLHVDRFRQVPSKGVVVTRDGWRTDVANKKTAILFDIDDSFLYFVDGRYRVEVTLEFQARGKAGFNLGYDSDKGYAASPWHWIAEGEGWQSHTSVLTDADFSDPWSDFRINVLASPNDVTVRRVTVRRVPVP